MKLRFKIIKIISKLHKYLHQISRGRLGGTLGGQEILFLTTVGRQSGKHRTVPLAAVRYGEQYLLVASFGGSPSHPAWFKNIQANGSVWIRVGSMTKQTIASIIDSHDSAYADLWDIAVASYNGFNDYKQMTLRKIPIVLVGYDDAV
jgi:deazaflavin-dependent oxidoreductase (nitroreductase family)